MLGYAGVSGLDAAGGDEGVQVAGGDAHVAAELGVGDAALEDEPAHEPQRGAQPLGGLLRRSTAWSMVTSLRRRAIGRDGRPPRRAVAVRVAGAGRVGGELGEQALPVALADAGGPGQAGTGRGLAGGDLGFVGRPDTGPRAQGVRPDAEACQLECGLVARPVRVCGFLAGLVDGQVGVGVAGPRPAPADLLHEQVGGEDERDRGHGEHQLGDRPVGAWAMLKATEARENSPASAHG